MGTIEEFVSVSEKCRDIFVHKLEDYGASWRILRPSSLTDQLFIKANRIRSLELSGEAKIDEGMDGEFMALVNYGIVGLIQLQLGYVDKIDVTNKEAQELYSKHVSACLNLMTRKNHDYGEAWRSMRLSSITDMILTKIVRIKQIEDNDGMTEVSEGIDSNYMDIINYAIFGIIKLED